MQLSPMQEHHPEDELHPGIKGACFQSDIKVLPHAQGNPEDLLKGRQVQSLLDSFLLNDLLMFLSIFLNTSSGASRAQIRLLPKPDRPQ